VLLAVFALLPSLSLGVPVFLREAASFALSADAVGMSVLPGSAGCTASGDCLCFQLLRPLGVGRQ
jgi:hypothetical protein